METLTIGTQTLPLPLAEDPRVVEMVRRIRECVEWLDKAQERLRSSELDVREAASYRCGWRAADARDSVLRLIDEETVAGDNEDVVKQLQGIFDTLSSYIRAGIAQDQEEQRQLQLARATYADGPSWDETDDYTEALSVEAPDEEADDVLVIRAGGELFLTGQGFELTEAITVAQRKRSATIVRRQDGKTRYMFPIPDKAHAKAALAYINQSDLTAAEKVKVRRKAYKVLGLSQKKESGMGANGHATIETVIDDLQFSESILATEALGKLAEGEAVATIIQPGFNRSKARFYEAAGLREAVDAGRFTGVKMYVNHPTPTEMRERPERDLRTWVASVKEAWVGEGGEVKGKIVVTQSWFRDYLKDLKEAGVLGDIGVSILALGKATQRVIEGTSTAAVEKLHAVLSVDWVTEPGAGGRVDTIWEAHAPARTLEQETNMLNSMTDAELVAKIQAERPQVLTLLEAGREAEAANAAALKERDDKLAEAAAALEAATARAEAAEAAAKKDRADAAKATHKTTLTDALAEAKLPEATVKRLLEQLAEPELEEDGTVKASEAGRIAQAIQAEQEYMAELLKAAGAGAGKGITGLGGGTERQRSGGAGEDRIQEATSLVDRDLARRLGALSPAKPKVEDKEGAAA